MDGFVGTDERIARNGFAPAQRRKPGQRRARALMQFIAAVGLVLSLAVAATAVSIEIVRAQGQTPEIAISLSR